MDSILLIIGGGLKIYFTSGLACYQIMDQK